ncbi:uncharacterized protein LOC117307250 [Asterias rubens]|uniref:uncharacterized protein LOC117307250 n=1 Tax=Asterias rubens TaxID=7604 RepID=UPI001455961D|nr:uncharacterized protein LOC117307250 [Asterias rubens]
MCQEFPGSPPAIINKDPEDSSGDLQANSPENSVTFRRRVLLLGRAGSGKTSLAKSLVSGSSQTSDGQTESLDVLAWCPFLGTTYENLLDYELTGCERSLVLEVWDLAGRRVWQTFHHLFLTAGTLPVIVFNFADQSSCDDVSQIVDMVWAKDPGCRLVIVGTHIDKLGQEESAEGKSKDILGVIRNRHAHCTQKLQQDLHNLKNIPKPRTPKDVERMKKLKDRLGRFPKPPSNIIGSSSKTAKGLDDVRKEILSAVLEANKSSSSLDQATPIRQATSEVYDDIMALRKESNVVVSFQEVKELFRKHETELSSVIEKKELTFFESSGVIQSYPNTRDPNDESEALICTNPSALAKALCLVHMSDTKKAFRFEAKRFWPKTEDGNSKKPNPALLVQALEEVATEGLIRECMLPLLWQDLHMNEKQTRLVIDLMARLGLLNRAADAHCDAEKVPLELPQYPGLLAKAQYRLPLLGLTPVTGPTLNWTPKPFKGDAQICWRYTFPLGTPQGLIPRLLVVCRANIQGAMYRHHWKNGILLKIGQVSVNIKQPENSQKAESLDIFVRVTIDEEGQKKATEVLWVVLARFLVIAQQFLTTWPGVYYQISILPSFMYYETDVSVDELPIELFDIFRSSASGVSVMKVSVQDTDCEVDLDLLFPLPGESKLSIFKWLQWLASLDIQLSESTPSIDEPEPSQSDTDSQTSLRPSVSPTVLSPSPTRSDSPRALKSPPVKVNKKKMEIKWKLDNGWRKVSLEEEMKEIQKVAASFVAAVLANSMAQFITERSKADNYGPPMEREAKQAAVLASARAAQAAQSGNPEAAAMAVVAASQAIENAMLNKKRSGHKNSSAMIKSRMCIIM